MAPVPTELAKRPGLWAGLQVDVCSSTEPQPGNESPTSVMTRQARQISEWCAAVG